MEQKTHVDAPANSPAIFITREFDLPVDLLYRAYTEAELVEQWMGTRVLELNNHNHGNYRFETSDAKGNIVFSANGVIHSVIPGESIIRTFEMENTGFPVQLEFHRFASLTEETSTLTIHIVFRSVADRDRLLQMPFAQGINMAHSRLQDIVQKLK